MLEIVLTLYITCLLLCLGLMLWHTMFLHQQFRSQKLATLNANLQKIGMFWSNSDRNFASLTSNSIEDDKKRTLRSFWMIGFVLSLLSVLGLIILTAVVLSMRFLARTRRETAVFRSPLCVSDMTVDEILAQIGELKTIL